MIDPASSHLAKLAEAQTATSTNLPGRPLYQEASSSRFSNSALHLGSPEGLQGPAGASANSSLSHVGNRCRSSRRLSDR